MTSPYDRSAGRYETRASRTLYGAVARDLADLLPELGSARALDLGCGTGISTEVVVRARPSWQWFASDASAPMLEQARVKETLGAVGWLLARAEAMPLETGSLDVVVSSVAWHWFEEAQALGEVRRVLRPGGYLLLAVPVRATGAREGGNSAVRRALMALRHEGAVAVAPGWSVERLAGPFPGFVEGRIDRIDRSETYESPAAWLEALEARGALVAMFGPAATRARGVLERLLPDGPVAYRWAIARVVLTRA